MYTGEQMYFHVDACEFHSNLDVCARRQPNFHNRLRGLRLEKLKRYDWTKRQNVEMLFVLDNFKWKLYHKLVRHSSREWRLKEESLQSNVVVELRLYCMYQGKQRGRKKRIQKMMANENNPWETPSKTSLPWLCPRTLGWTEHKKYTNSQGST